MVFAKSELTKKQQSKHLIRVLDDLKYQFFLAYCETVHHKKSTLSEEQLADPAVWQETLKELQAKYEQIHDFKNEKAWLGSFDQETVTQVFG